ncbi:MAG: ribonuclease E/G [Alphaproteobacteria bacterium]|nr:ribonuclease E/G [Alphaproteobacteria bacterium SS10]
MTRPTLIIEPVGEAIRAALFQAGGRLRQFWLMPDPAPSLYPGAIVEGAINGRNSAMGSLTVEVPGEGAVQVPARGVGQEIATLPIEIIAAPQRGTGTGRQKPARGTAQISAAGRYLVLRDPKGRGVKLSNRMAAGAVEPLVAEMQKEAGSWIIRHNALDVEPTTVLAEAQRLLADWTSSTRPAMSLPARIFQEMVVEPDTVDVILDAKLSDETMNKMAALLPSEAIRAEQEAGDRLDLDRHQYELQQAVAPFDGGQLCIEPTEALIAIDMDLASLEHCHAGLLEAVRQIQLRNLCGSIVIDLPRGIDPAEVKKAMTNYLEQADMAATVHGVSRGGLLELSISRRWPMLHEILAHSPG